MIDRGERRLTPDRAVEIWKAMALTFSGRGKFNGLDSDFKLKKAKEPRLTGGELSRATFFCSEFHTERKFILACLGYHLYKSDSDGYSFNICKDDREKVREGYASLMAVVDSLTYRFGEFLNELQPDELVINHTTGRPYICDRGGIYKNIMCGDPVLMSFISRFTTVNIVWGTGITDPMRKDKELFRVHLTKITYSVIKRYCDPNLLAIKGSLMGWKNSISEEVR